METDQRCSPVNPIVAGLVNRLDADNRYDYEERAGIMTFDANLPREYAESLALIDLLHRNPLALSGITVLQVELDGGTEFVITTEPVRARQHLADIHATVIAEVSLQEVLAEQYGGIAALTFLG